MSGAMPAPARYLAGFPPYLRGFGFTTSPEQTVAFLEAVELLGPGGIEEVRRAAVATLSPPHERSGEFDALFRAWFHGEFAPVPRESDDETEIRVHDEGGATYEPPDEPDLGESGQSATAAEMLGERRFRAETAIERLRRFCARGAGAASAPPGLAPQAGAPGRDRRSVPRAPHRGAPRRRHAGAAVAAAHAASTPDPAPRRRIGIDEGAHRVDVAIRARALPRGRAHGGLHARHPSHPGDRGAPAAKPRRRAREGIRPGA